MDITAEHIGAVICRCDTGARFLVTDVSADSLSIVNEDGTRDQLSSHTVNGGVEHDEAQINSFHQNMKLGQSLLAAEQAAQRRLAPNRTSDLAAEEASRVSQIAREQRQAFLNRLCAERNARTAEHTPSLDDVLKSATERSANQQPEQIHRPFNLNR